MMGLNVSLDILSFVLIWFFVGVEDQFVHFVTVVLVDVVYFSRALFVEPIEPVHFFGFCDAAFFLFFLEIASLFYQ